MFLFLLRTAAMSITVLLLTEPAAFAYTDPGSGLFLWQMFIAALAGLMFYLTSFKKRITRWFNSKGKTKDN